VDIGQASPAPPLDQARRARTALPLALVTFAVTYVAMLFTVRWIKPMGEQGWDALAYFVGLLVFGALLVIVIIPIVVFTLGRKVDAATREWSTPRAAVAFGGAGMALGLVAAVVLTVWGGVSLVGALANVVVPGAVAGLATRVLLPSALEHRWVLILFWVLAALPLAGAFALAASLSH
jgi:hypothetical protein